jgi:hypothetical protein
MHHLISADFHWWLEVDSNIRLTVSWVWLGHPAVTHIGGCSDCDLSILNALVREVNWSVERERAIETVEGWEIKALEAAQQNRRNKSVVSGSKLKPVDPPPLPAATPVQKRVVHRVALARAGFQAASAEAMRREQARTLSKSPPHGRYKYDPRRPEHGVTRTPTSEPVLNWEWERLSDRHELWDVLADSPAGTYTAVVMYGFVNEHVDCYRDAAVAGREYHRRLGDGGIV